MTKPRGPGGSGQAGGVSRECRDALDMLYALAAEALSREDAFDLNVARASSKLFSRPPEVAAARTFLADTVRAEWACAPGADPAVRLLYLHGGGYVSGDLDTTIRFAELVAQAAHCCVLAIEYRLAPEHPFPHALNDAVDAYRWLLENGPEGPGPARKTVIAGDSAGGGLALSALMKLRDQGGDLPDCAVTLSALTDLALTGETLTSRADRDPVMNLPFLALCFDAYASGVDRRHPLLSPLYGDPQGLPPLFMQVGGREILLDDTLRFAEKARASGVEVHLDIWPEMFHSWQLFAPWVPEAQQALDRVGRFVRGRT